MSVPTHYAYIEGIGGGGFLRTCFIFELGCGIECVGKVFNQTLYPDSTFNCVYATSLVDVSIQNKIQVYPNPTSKVLQIHASENSLEVKIMDILGNMLYHNRNYKVDEMIDVENFQDGIYSVQVLIKDKLIETKKVTKN